MSLSKPLTLSRLNDSILGSFGLLQPSETIEHLVRYLGTWSGSDKLFMIIQYSIKLLVPLLNLRARLQYRAGLRKSPESSAAAAYAKLGSILSDSRTLWRIWGLLPIIQWLVSLERNPQPTRTLLTIERLQGWSMLAYYPLEHLSYLLSHGLIPSTIYTITSLFSSSAKPIRLNANVLGMWSCRFWALYVLLQFAHLREDRKLLRLRERNLRKAKGVGLTPAEKQELKQRRDAFWSEVITNLGYLPLTIHWSLERGIIKNDVWVGVFGLIAGIASFRSGWKATALPSPPSAPQTADGAETVDAGVGANGAVGYE
ncbi:putative peroxisomal biogenesis factor 11 (PEX11) [Lyophyllum shimeji]|uniref:Peroxisomal biogenesis factor 11 (PEX11) n=1 Tax=Lyophyllum shimeji TaxID=47721 RepID=A0A9P3PS02_LYOSH|nr:putative peroxisomal biogenesis factor 11 (PEX11) [Lyophyllum shimeji]